METQGCHLGHVAPPLLSADGRIPPPRTTAPIAHLQCGGHVSAQSVAAAEPHP